MTMTVLRVLLLLTVAPFTVSVSAQSNAPAMPDEPRLLDTVVVSGSLPAPKLWELTKGEKRLLIMGSLTPTPRAMTWDSGTVARRIGQAELVLGPLAAAETRRAVELAGSNRDALTLLLGSPEFQRR